MPSAPGKIRPRLITFDFGDTLVTSAPPYLERIAIGLTELGFTRTAKDVEAAFYRSDLKQSAQMLALQPFENAAYQKSFAAALFEELGLTGDLEQLRPKLTEWLINFRPKRLLMPGAGELLEALKRRGYSLAVISNNDGNTREKCGQVDIEKYFDFILDSTLERVMKPDRRIFQRALDQAGVGPDEVLHVGDLWGCDVRGARAAGLWAAWLANGYVRPEALERVFTIKKLLDLLKVVAA